MIRRDAEGMLRDAAKGFPAVTLTGPRQSGKSTLCRSIFSEHPYVNLEAPDVRAFANEDPRAFLEQHPDGAVLDEIQRCPELPSYLQGLIDDDPTPGRWILTGSQNLALIDSVSQSLAGRSAVLRLYPLTLRETRRFKQHPKSLWSVIIAGGYPRIFDHKLQPSDWLGSYIATYVERDVRSITRVGDLSAFQRFLRLCAGRTSQLLNLSALAADCGVSQPTAKSWLSVLEASFIVRLLPAWSGNIRKRLTRSPKLHFIDTGVACWLLGIRTVDHLRTHPLRGPIFETWVISEIIKSRANRGELDGVYHVRDRHGLETDLLIEDGSGRTLVEAKSGGTVTGEAFSTIRRMSDALEQPRDTRQIVLHGGKSRQERAGVVAAPWEQIDQFDW